MAPLGGMRLPLSLLLCLVAVGAVVVALATALSGHRGRGLRISIHARPNPVVAGDPLTVAAS